MIELLLEAERALTHGRVDHAERLYRQVAAADPRSSIALVGLARVALERADDRTAYLFGRRAMAIDPENPAARHLVMRLAEVLTGRGEPVPGDLEVVVGARGREPASPVTGGAPPPAPPPPAAEPRSPAGPVTGRDARPAAPGLPPRRAGIIGRLLGRGRRR